MKVFYVCLAVVGVLAVSILGAFILITQFPQPLERLLARDLPRYVDELEIDSVTIEKVSLNASYDYMIDDLMIAGRYQEKKFSVAANIVIYQVLSLFDHRKPKIIDIENLIIEHPEVKISEGAIHTSVFQGLNDDVTYSGDARIQHIVVQGQLFEDVQFDFSGDTRALFAKEIRSIYNKGVLNGSVNLVFEPALYYELDINLAGVDTGLKPGVDQQVKALISGTLKASGTEEQVLSFDTKLNAPDGARVNAQLLSLLLNYIPQSIQKQQVNKIIASGGQIYLDKFKVEMSRKDKDMIHSLITLKSTEFNLDINLSADINIDGGLMGLARLGLKNLSKESR